MKKRFFIIGLTALLVLPAFAELTVDDTVSREYLINHGYSYANTNAIRKNIAQINGEELSEPLEKEYYGNPVARFFRRIFMYVDPALDDHSFENDHQIKTSPIYTDL